MRIEDSGTDRCSEDRRSKDGRQGGLDIWGLLIEDVTGRPRHPSQATGTAGRLRWGNDRHRQRGRTGAGWFALLEGLGRRSGQPSRRRPAVPVACAGCRNGLGRLYGYAASGSKIVCWRDSCHFKADGGLVPRNSRPCGEPIGIQPVLQDVIPTARGRPNSLTRGDTECDITIRKQSFSF